MLAKSSRCSTDGVDKPKSISSLDRVLQDCHAQFVLKVMECQIIQSEDFLSVSAIETIRSICSIHWLRDEAEVLTTLCSLCPVWNVRVQIRQDKLHSSIVRPLIHNPGRARRKTLGITTFVASACEWGSGYARRQLRIQVFLDEGCRSACASAEVNVGVSRYGVRKGSRECAGNELCRRSFL